MADQQESKAKRPNSERLRALWPDIWELIRPRRALLGFGLVLMAVNRLAGLVLPGSTKYLVDDIIGKHHLRLLVPLVLAVLGATVIQGVSSFALTQLLSKSAQRLIADLRRKVQAHVGHLPVAFYDSNKTGALVARIMSDVEGVRNLIGTGLVEFAGGILTALFALVVLIRISPLMTGLAFLFLIGLGLGLRRAFGVIRPIFRARSKINAEVTGRLTESLGGVRVIKGYHAESREENVFSKGVQRLLDNVLTTLTATSLMGLSSSTLLGVVSALVMFIGARQIVAGHMTLGTFLTFTIFLGLLVAPVFQVVAIGTQLTEALAGLERTREILDENQEDADPRRTYALGPVVGEVEFDNVSFAYEQGKTVLYEVSFHAAPGTVTALVGPSGAGKSTIIGLIAAFYIPTSGQVTVDGVDLTRVRLDSYRAQIGVVLQDSFLFDGTIWENVAFSRPDASRDDILHACRIARVDEFAESFKGGYETIVGERGVKLSGGQKQRVSIARALLADPRILILDEATSSLDSESEAMIQEGLAVLMRGRTTFVIAHRLSTIRRAEQILVVEAGRIIERGTHASLLADGGRYFDLYTKQHGVESNLFLAPGEGGEAQPAPVASAADSGTDTASKPVSLPDAVRLLSGKV
jgi:subfamily B ATP-binding cassette protein MsbA